MDDLLIDWNQERPDPLQMVELWNSIKLIKLETSTSATENLKAKISETHSNGGIQVHKYGIASDKYFKWFASRNRLDEIEFAKNLFRLTDLEEYRKDLKITALKPKVTITNYKTDIYDLPGHLARIMGYGGAYKKIDQHLAWQTACDFVKSEFQNRFEEFNTFEVAIEDADWFYNIAWDYSIILFDKRNYEITIIDITDTD